MCVHTWQVHPCLCICTHMNTQTRKLNKSALATHQKAGPCWALWRMERNHAEQGQAEGRKERRGAYNGTGSYGWAGLGWRSTCTEAQYSKWHRTIWAYWYTRVISVLRNRQHRGHKFKVILGCETTLNLVKATGDLVSTPPCCRQLPLNETNPERTATTRCISTSEYMYLFVKREFTETSVSIVLSTERAAALLLRISNQELDKAGPSSLRH